MLGCVDTRTLSLLLLRGYNNVFIVTVFNSNLLSNEYDSNYKNITAMLTLTGNVDWNERQLCLTLVGDFLELF